MSAIPLVPQTDEQLALLKHGSTERDVFKAVTALLLNLKTCGKLHAAAREFPPDPDKSLQEVHSS